MARARTVPSVPDPWSDARAHLRRLGPAWRSMVDRVGPCRLSPAPDRFATLARSIISQQISTKAAEAIAGRVRAACGDGLGPTPLRELGEAGLRGAGVSGVKARYLLNLADAVARGDLPLDEVDAWDDEAIVASLTAVKGIGVWTAEMFLIFALNRPDVLPVHDLGIRAAIRTLHGLEELPRPQECRTLAEPWRPYRSIASWYLWRSKDLGGS